MYSWQNIQQASNFDRIFHIKLDNKQMRLIYSMVNDSDPDGAAWPTKWVAFSPWIQWNGPILSCSHPVFVSQYFFIKVGLWGLMPLSTIFQLYSGSFFVNNYSDTCVNQLPLGPCFTAGIDSGPVYTVSIIWLPYKWVFSREPNFAISFQIGGFFLAVLNFWDPEF